MGDFDFKNVKYDLASINSFLDSQGVKLSETEQKKLVSIFNEADIYDDKKGVLNFQEKNKFIQDVNSLFSSISQNIKDFATGVNDAFILKNSQKATELKSEPSGIEKPVIEPKHFEKKEVNWSKVISEQKNKTEICQKMYKKWSAKFPNSPLKQDFYNKLYDVLDTMNIKISESSWNKSKYDSPKEQAFDEVVAIFAGESQLNPRSKNGPYNGLFQLANVGMIEIKRWAKKHPDVSGMKNISSNITTTGFRKLSGNTQLDYLVAMIGKNREYSGLSADEAITPGQLWAMIKSPYAGKKPYKIAQKNEAIQNVFTKNKIPYGIT